MLSLPRKHCCRSKKWRWSNQWRILGRRSQIGGHRFPNFETLDAKVASVLKTIIMNPYFKKKVNLEEQEAQMQDQFLRGRQIAYMIYEYFPVTGAHEAVLNCTDLFSLFLQRDDIHDSRRTVAKTSLHQAISGIGEVRVHRQMYRVPACEIEIEAA